MQKGFNSDISINGLLYHVQTEDWGFQNPYIVTHVFQSGAVIKRIKSSYEELLPKEALKDPQKIQLAMKTQHEVILNLIQKEKP
ncbi:MAG: hypothetical protein D6797_07940 [Bdellovibrio sp.]|nr:MAG: hypothetical protein D6797_07940 [Bdellovibrio sp.]